MGWFDIFAPKHTLSGDFSLGWPEIMRRLAESSRTFRKPDFAGTMREPAPYSIAIEGHEDPAARRAPIPSSHPSGRYEAIEPHMDGTDRTYSAASEMRADGCALAYETFAVVFLVVIPEGDLLFRYSMDE
jgi:hypothetical protein